ncbi:MAG: SDR family oxidoreductase [Haloechinothrix sp.]
MARMKKSLSLANKVVAITGGARGIGRATAEAFLDAGAKVAIGDLDVELAEKTAVELGAKPGARIIGLPLDVTGKGSFEAFLTETENALGALDVLVNNAGIMPTGLLLDETDAMTDRMIGINLRGVITGSKLACARFAQRGRGSVVNIASLAGVQGLPALATYCATKHAVVGFSEAMHWELRDSGVSVSAVLPGVVRTELSAGAKVPKWLEGMSTVDPEDVARTVVRAVRTGKERLTVPKSLAATLTVLSVLPAPVRRAADRITGASVAFTRADPAARAAYHRRLEGDTQ